MSKGGTGHYLKRTAGRSKAMESGLRTTPAPVKNSFERPPSRKEDRLSCPVDWRCSLDPWASGRARHATHADHDALSRSWTECESQMDMTWKINKLLFMFWYLEIYSWERPSSFKRIFGVKFPMMPSQLTKLKNSYDTWRVWRVSLSVGVAFVEVAERSSVWRERAVGRWEQRIKGRLSYLVLWNTMNKFLPSY